MKTIKVKSTVTSEIEKEIQVPAYFKEKHGSTVYRLNEDGTMDGVTNGDGWIQIVHNGYEIEKKVLYPSSTVEEWNETLLKAKEKAQDFFSANLIPSREEVESK